MIFNFFKKNSTNSLSWDKEFRIALGAHWGLSAQIARERKNFIKKRVRSISEEKGC